MYNNRRGFLRWLALGFGSLVGLLPALAQRRFNRAIAQGAASGPKAAGLVLARWWACCLPWLSAVLTVPLPRVLLRAPKRLSRSSLKWQR